MYKQKTFPHSTQKHYLQFWLPPKVWDCIVLVKIPKHKSDLLRVGDVFHPSTMIHEHNIEASQEFEFDKMIDYLEDTEWIIHTRELGHRGIFFNCYVYNYENVPY